MSIENSLQERSGGKCELCGDSESLRVFEVPFSEQADADHALFLCLTCTQQIEDPQQTDPHHWRCLNERMWSSVPAVQVMAWRMLTRLSDEGWPRDLLDMLYLDESLSEWARASEQDDATPLQHVDSNGHVLQAGDTVTLIKDLPVKGANFTAKRGSAVRGISLVSDNPLHIEGRVNGQKIVILTQFVKKSN